jgi:predicted NBD/HSP70 family sugar kinase
MAMAPIKRTKIINRFRILREIWMNKEISRVDIARALGLDKSTISNTVKELLKMGVVVESSEGVSGPQGGRKPVSIKLNKNFGCFLGIELRPESYTAVAVDLEGEIIYSRSEKIVISGDRLGERFLEIAAVLAADLERKEIGLLGIGVGLSGVVNAREGIIKYSIPLGISSGYDFCSAVASHFGVPVFIDNDANACVWGELAFHRIKDLRDFIFLLLEFRDLEPGAPNFWEKVGVGIGLALNGNVHYGHDFSAGEFRSIFRNDGSQGQFHLSLSELRVIEDDEEVRTKFLRELGAHVALFVNTFNLSHVILGGFFERYGKQVSQIISEEIRKNWPYPYENKNNIWLSSFGNQAVAYGAAGMVLNKLFSDLEIFELDSDLHRTFLTGKQVERALN